VCRVRAGPGRRAGAPPGLGCGGSARVDDAAVGGQSSATPRSRECVMRTRRGRATSTAKHNQMKEPGQHRWTGRRGWMEGSPDEGAENAGIGPHLFVSLS
jgi:hypothetical protein